MFVPKRSLILPRSLSPLSMCPPWDEEALEYIDGGGGGLISAPPGIVQVDHLGTAQSSGSSIATFDFTGLTISGGLTNSALIISVMQIQTGGVAPIISVTWDNGGTPQAMTALATIAPAPPSTTLALYGLRSPHSGTVNFITGDGCYDVGAAPNVTLTATHLSGTPHWGAAAVDVSN